MKVSFKFSLILAKPLIFAIAFVILNLLLGITAFGQNSNVTISTAATSGGSFTGITPNRTFTPTADNANIQASQLVTQLLTNNVTIVTSNASGTQAGNVTFSTAVTAAKNTTAQYTFTVTAAGSITVSSAINLTSSAAGGTNDTARPGTHIVFTAGTSIAITAAITASGNVRGTGTNATGGNMTFTGPSGIRLTANLTSAGAAGGAAGNYSFSTDATTVTTGGGINDGQTAGVISGGNFTKSGTGALNIGGLNTYTGSTTVSSGILRASNNTVVAATSGPFGNNASGLNLAGGTIQSNVTTFSRPITVTASNSGLDAYGSARTISSAITLATAGTFNLNIGGTTAASAEGQVLTLSGIISNTTGTLGLTKIGSSTAILSGSNSYTGSTTVSAGILRATTANVIASTNGAFGNNASGLNLNGGTIQSDVLTFSRPITVTATNSGLDAYGSARTVSSPITLASAGTFNLNIGGTTAAGAEGQDLTLSGIISNSSGTLGLTKIGTSKLILSGTNTFSGGVTLNSGTLNIDNNQALGTIAGTFTIAGGTIDASAAGITTLNYPLALNADFTFTGTNSLNLGAGTVSMNADRQITVSANTLTLGGTISQSTRTLTKAGAGTLSFGSNTVTLSGLSISAGTLTSTSGTLNLAGSFSNSGTFTAGTGTVNYNGSSQTIAPVTYNNLTISQSAGNATLGGNATVNGILNLSSGNLAVTDPFELTMGGSATTTGAKDVTGIVKRTNLVAGTEYTFGNQYTTINFQNLGTLPTDVSVKISIGSAPSWKTDAVQRTYDIIRTGGSGSYATINLHYLDAELNGNTENKLVTWHLHTDSSVEEHGRSNYNTTDNWVGQSSFNTLHLSTAFGSTAWTLANTALSSSTWTGSINTDWNNPGNWTPPGVPSDLTDVIIPDASTTPNDPTLGLSIAVKRLTINSGGILNSAATSTLTISGANGAWSNNGGTFNASTGTVIFTNAAATVSGVTDFYNVTINSGAALRMGDGSTMRIGGTMTNNGTWSVAGLSGTTVEYNGGSQTVLNPNGATPGYNNLILSGTGTKTMPGTTLSLRNAFSMSGTASATAAAAINTTGNFTIGSSSSFTAGAFTHTVGGNFSNAGTFTGTGSTFNFNGAGAQTINNANTWYNLSITGTAARTVTFQSGVAQTVSNSLTLTGASGQLLSLAPSATPTKWQLNAPATQSVSYVSASYSDASSGTAISADNGTNINNSNNLNWNFSAQATPTFSLAAGAIAFGTTVTITSAGADAIYYTTDGTDPTITSTNQATTPLVINSTVTVKALAVKAGSPNSAIASASYTQSATADLTGLVLSGSPSNYTFASGTYTYNGVRVLNSVSSIIITPTGLGNITVDGTTVSSGTPSVTISLTAGVQKAIVIVATEAGKSPKTYTINITRALDPAKAITAFTILGDGTVNESAKTISVTVPCDTDLTALVASFTTTGASVKIGGVSQSSGTTANNFSSPVTYTVTAADATTQDYVVTVTVAADPSKAITAFTILGNGTVNESAKTIAVTLPFGTDLTALVANFSTTGISVKVGLTEQTSGTTANNFSSPLTYTVTAADATTQDYAVTVTVAANPAKAITAFTILGNGTINESGKTIAVTLPYGTDVSALVASFSTSGASVKVGAVTQTSGTTANNFSTPLTYTVTATNTTTQDYVVTVTVAANPAKAITAFTILGNGTVNESGKTIAVTVPFGTDLTALVASFTTTGASVKVGAVTQTSGTTANNFSSPLTYTVTAADASTQDYVVSVSVSSNTSKALTAFTILGNGTVNESTKTITVTVPFGTDLTALKANFSTTGASVKVGGVTQSSGTTANNFSSPLTYTVTAADASSQDYVVTVSVANASSLLKVGSIGSDQVLCDGITAPLSQTAAATGGSGIYTYQWQKSIISASTDFTDIIGATSTDYTPDNLSQTTWYKRLVSSPGYNSAPLASNVITLTVVPALSHNLIDAPSLTAFSQSGDPGVITGSNPTGGSGDYTYQWTSSIVGGNCNNISGATSKDYDPGIITETTNFRRVVMSGTCSYISNRITFTVNISNHPPVASDDSYTTVKNTPLVVSASGGLLKNDADPDNNMLTATVISSPDNGTLTLNSDGGFTYTPTGNFIGRDRFTYSACDNGIPDFCDTGTVTISVTERQLLGIAKTVSTPMRQLDGFDSNILTYKITVRNYGTVSLKNVQVTDDLTKSFPFPTQFSLQGIPTTSRGVLQASSAYDGRVNNKLLKLNNTLLVGESDTIRFTIKVTPFNYIMGPYYNSAIASATDPDGKLAEDISTAGTNPDPDNNGIPDESLATIVMLEKVTVRVPEGFSPNSDGVNDRFVIENLDNEQISLQVFNPLGILIYKNDNYRNEWDGISNQGSNKGKDIPDGTYYYVVSKVSKSNKEKYHSFITVNR